MGADADCPATDPVCSEFGFCQCECYKPGDKECWSKGEEVCGAGDGNNEKAETQDDTSKGGNEKGDCNADADCPATDPICSEFGFCQCECYKPGDEECWGRGEE